MSHLKLPSEIIKIINLPSEIIKIIKKSDSLGAFLFFLFSLVIFMLEVPFIWYGFIILCIILYAIILVTSIFGSDEPTNILYISSLIITIIIVLISYLLIKKKEEEEEEI